MENKYLDYNSTRERLVMPEYGRTIQNMVRYATTIENREERNRCAHSIVSIMANMYPQLKDTPDFKHKLWDHLYIISDFKLDIDAPYPMPEPVKLMRKPDRVPYPGQNIRLKHYGHIVEDLIEKASNIEDPQAKRVTVENIANFMKASLLAWNKDFATDERLFNDIRILSSGRLVIDEEDGIKTAAIRPEKMQNPRGNYGKKANNAKHKNKGNKNRNRY